MIIRRTITKEEITGMPKVVFPGKIHVVNTPWEAETAVTYLKQYPLLGIDTETRPSFTKWQNHQVALLQVATPEECFLFRLNLMGIPLPVLLLLENPHITKVGLSLKDDFMMLHKRAPFEPRGIVELQEFVRPFGIQEMSLQKIYAILFGEKISKGQRLSNWEAQTLTIPQQQYAATDAWTCINIYRKLQELEASGDYEIEELPDETADSTIQHS
ncbi:MAG: 3'-5' exonuclease domain-containing protein 2 [Bacteroides sp.]|nr:3'-5' exonuclease domain-containing protein 2 [Bacteroides sp.]